MAENIIEAITAGLKSANASFQLKARPFHATPSNFSPSVFFSGSKSELRHVVQVCANKEPFAAVVDISLYSLTLSSNNLTWLSERIAEYNREQVIGFFVTEDNVGKMQIRFLVRLHLDKRKLNDSSYLRKVTWDAITSADKHYRRIAEKFLEDLKLKESAPKDLDSLAHRIARMDLMKRNIDFELKVVAGFPSFVFNLTIKGLSPPFGLTQCTLTATDKLLTLRATFCDEGQTAVFKQSAADSLFAQVNSLNVKMMICHLVIKEMAVEMVLHMYLLELPKEKLEYSISYALSVFIKQLERVFPSFERLYCEELFHFEMNKIYKLSSEEQLEFELKKRTIFKLEESYKYFFFQGLVTEGLETLVQVPCLFKALTLMLQKKMIISERFASILCLVLQKLANDELFYRNLPTLIYLTGDMFLHIRFIRELEIAPQCILDNSPMDKIAKSAYTGLLQRVNKKQLKIVLKFRERLDNSELESLLRYEHGARIDFSAVKCESKHCDHQRSGWHQMRHKIGRQFIRLTPVFDSGRYRDIYEIMNQYFKSVKCYHGSYQRRPLGVTIEDRAQNRIFLVEEEATYESMTSFFKTARDSFEQTRQKLYSDISQAVAHLHSKGVSQLLLCPSSIAVDVTHSTGGAPEVRAKLAAVPALTSENYTDVITYTDNCALEDPANYDWKAADMYSLRLMKEYLIDGLAPISRQDVILDCTLSKLRGTDVLTAALKTVLR